jgi:ankyrin repeat protein
MSYTLIRWLETRTEDAPIDREMLTSASINAADQHGVTALMVACRRGLVKAVTSLLAQSGLLSTATDNEGNTALMHLCLLGSAFYPRNHFPILQALQVAAPCLVNMPNLLGITPLMAAIKQNTMSAITELILSRHIDYDVQCCERKTALIYAIIAKKKNTVGMLLEVGARTDLQDTEGKTAMDYAQDNGMQSMFGLRYTP